MELIEKLTRGGTTVRIVAGGGMPEVPAVAGVTFAPVAGCGASGAGRAERGCAVMVEAGRKIGEPLYFVAESGEPFALKVILGEGASLNMVLIAGGAVRGGVAVELSRGASLTLGEAVAAAAGESLNLDLDLHLGENASASVAAAELGEGETRMGVSCHLDGCGASFEGNALFMAADGEHKSVGIRVEHNVPECRSNVMAKGIAAGSGRGEFDGLVYVAQDAQHTEAYQQSRNLLIGDAARIRTSPQLEIYADDVRCSHGATVGQMDDEAVYYMRQRGLSEAEARGLQMRGFVADVTSRFACETLREAVSAAADARIAALR